ncbi:MAG: ribosome maturation factor RimP [Deltaproteobacteria bacterium]|nr:ribosome maturation factor RimP [Deltaproteobacteria bacterium]MBW2128445.1 ribosome maturation factor RimP [Deltaproteobacteria bacterium]MBW2303501.1 ribosome maturation factor RimP [Deltaproteobacteria bacterium]
MVEGILEDLGFELIDVEYLSSRGRWILRLYIDTEGGVTIDDCARVSGEIGDLIDVKDIIPHEYVLEVSSPGLDRPLKKEKHFLEAVGKKIRIRTVRPIGGRRIFVGRLKKFKDGVLDLEWEGKSLTFSLSDLEKANVVYEFDI